MGTPKPAIKADEIEETLRGAQLDVIPMGKGRHEPGVVVAQMKDASLVLCSGDNADELRESVRAALRGQGYMVKDSAELPGAIYVVGRLDWS